MNNETLGDVLYIAFVFLISLMAFLFVFGFCNWVYKQTDFYKEEICNKYNGVIHVDEDFKIKCLVKNGND